jgi:hypothetical protein
MATRIRSDATLVIATIDLHDDGRTAPSDS